MAKEIDYYDHPAVSNSKLSWLNPDQGGSPLKYVKKLEESAEEAETKSLNTGKLLHICIFEPEKYVVSDVKPPSDNIMAIVNAFHESISREPDAIMDPKFDAVLNDLAKAQNWGQSYKEETRLKKIRTEGGPYYEFLTKADGKLIIDKSTAETVKACEEELRNNDKVSDLLFGSDLPGFLVYNEQEIYFRQGIVPLGADYKTKVECKAKLDRIIVKVDEDKNPVSVTIPDLKTTSSPLSKFGGSVLTYHYYRQAAFYILAVRAWLMETFGKNNVPISFLLVPVTTKGIIESGIFRIPDDYINEGLEEMYSLLARYAYHRDDDQWLTPFEVENRGYYTMRYIPIEERISKNLWV